MASKRELEERIDKLEKHFNRYQSKVHNLEDEVFNTEKEEPQYPQVGDQWRNEQEPHYLQVGDQWRDEEGNEYVLARITKSLNSNNILALINVSKGKIHCNEVMETKLGKTTNTKVLRHELGITDSMTKIK